MHDMRHLIDLVEARMPEFNRLIGNCTHKHMAPVLEAMMDDAKSVSYRTLVSAVGLPALREGFPDYEWGRGSDLKMKDDYAVSYYFSQINGEPVYYVRHSGIEYVFAKSDFDLRAERVVSQKKSRTKYQIKSDGVVLPKIVGGDVVLTIEPIDAGTVEITQSSSMNPAVHASILTLLKKLNATTIVDDGDEKSISEYLSGIARHA